MIILTTSTDHEPVNSALNKASLALMKLRLGNVTVEDDLHLCCS